MPMIPSARPLLLAAALVLAAPAGACLAEEPVAQFAVEDDDVALQIITEKGYLAFLVRQDWPVVSSATLPPVAHMAFQLPNPADEGTEHSTNLLVGAVYKSALGDERAQNSLKLTGAPVGPGEVTEASYGGWTTFSQVSDDAVPYHILDARYDFPEYVATVRLAWPELPGNAPDYDRTMQATFTHFLDSVMAGEGPPPEMPGVQTYRPQP